jgi:Mrp family chromosome partitioning ATPase
VTAVQIDVADGELRSWVGASAVAAGLAISEVRADCRVVDLAACTSDPTLVADPATVVVTRRDDMAVDFSAGQSAIPELLFLPEGNARLTERLRSFVPDRSGLRSANVISVTGTRGGAGSTTLAAGLAAAAADLGSVVFVDADPAGAPVDINAGIEGDRGIRWSDVVDVGGQLAVSALQGRMPSTGDIDWLATPLGTANSMSWRSVTDALIAGYDTVIIDLPRYRLTATPPPAAAIPILLTTLELTSLNAAQTLLESGRFGADPLVTLRSVGGPLRMSTASDTLSTGRLREVPASRVLRGASDFGDLARAVAKGGFARACQRLLLEALR